MFRGFVSILYKEAIQIRRDPVTLVLLFIIPVFQLFIFGYAINMTVRDIKTAVYNLDNRRESRELLDSFINTKYFKLTRTAASDDELNRLITAGEVKVGIKVPPDYTENLLNGRQATVLVLIDGSDSSVAGQAVTAATSVGMRESIERLITTQAASARRLPIDVRPKMLFNPDSRSPNFMVPGLIAVILQMITTILTAFSIVRERERGTLEQLLVTPVKPFGLMLGKLVPYSVIGFIEACSVLTVMRVVFKVPINGSLLLLLALVVMFLFSALGIGLLISTKAANQIQAIQLAWFIMLPSVLLSGFMFPRDSMPLVINWIGYAIPATYFINIMRGIVLRGAGVLELWPSITALAFMGVFFLSLSAFRFKRKTAE
jgi:ABC transporter DrrB family efflux protein